MTTCEQGCPAVELSRLRATNDKLLAQLSATAVDLMRLHADYQQAIERVSDPLIGICMASEAEAVHSQILRTAELFDETTSNIEATPPMLATEVALINACPYRHPYTIRLDDEQFAVCASLAIDDQARYDTRSPLEP